MATNADSSAWTVEVAYSERDGVRTCTTTAAVTDTGEADVVTLQTVCSNLASGPIVIAPPRRRQKPMTPARCGD